MVLEVKNLPAHSGDIRDKGSIPESGRHPGEGTATHSSILPWRIPWTQKPGRLQSTGLQSRAQLKRLSTRTQALKCLAKEMIFKLALEEF